MKLGGNESATKYFQSHGGSAALASKDTKVKYTSNAATKYKDELKRRAAADAEQLVMDYPHSTRFSLSLTIGLLLLGTPMRLSSQTSPLAQPPMAPALLLIQRMISSLLGINHPSNDQATPLPAQVPLQS